MNVIKITGNLYQDNPEIKKEEFITEFKNCYYSFLKKDKELKPDAEIHIETYKNKFKVTVSFQDKRMPDYHAYFELFKKSINENKILKDAKILLKIKPNTIQKNGDTIKKKRDKRYHITINGENTNIKTVPFIYIKGFIFYNLLFLLMSVPNAFLVGANTLPRTIIYIMIAILTMLSIIYIFSGTLWKRDYYLKASKKNQIINTTKPIKELFKKDHTLKEKPKLGKQILTIILYFIVLKLVVIALVSIASLLANTPMEITSNDQIIQSLTNVTRKVNIFIAIAIFAPITEELIYRYAFFNFFHNKKVALITSSVIFGMGHSINNISEAIIYIGLGFMLGLIYYKTEDIRISIGVHFLNNLFPALLIMTL